VKGFFGSDLDLGGQTGSARLLPQVRPMAVNNAADAVLRGPAANGSYRPLPVCRHLKYVAGNE
jgi:hypothetical protein